jgi:hypothetical protein
MNSRIETRRLFFSVPFVILLAAGSFAQTTASDDSDKFIGKWISDAEWSDFGEMSSIARSRIELEITKDSSGFSVRRSDRNLHEIQSDPSVEKSLFTYMNGRLERDGSAQQTWEPNEFPKRISEKIKLSPNGKKLIFTTILQSSGNRTIPGAGRKPLRFSNVFTRAKN